MQIDTETYIEALEATVPWIKEQLTTLREVIDDRDKTREAAHSIKGTAGSLGIEKVYHSAAQLEMVAKGTEQGDTQQLLEQLSREIAEAMPYIDQYLSQSINHESPTDQ